MSYQQYENIKMNEMTPKNEMESTQINSYSDSDHDSIIAGISDLQEVERSMSDTRLPGSEVAEKYFDYLQKELAEKHGAIFVARIEGSIIGFIACMVEHDDTPAETPESTTYGYISDAYVAPEYRGKGVFGELNQKAEEYLSRFPEVKLIRISVLANNENAIKAYERSGYKTEDVRLSKRVSK